MNPRKITYWALALLTIAVVTWNQGWVATVVLGVVAAVVSEAGPVAGWLNAGRQPASRAN